MIQMRLWNYDCGHQYVVMLKRLMGQAPKMVCVHCGSDVDHKSVLRAAAEAAKAK